MAADSTPVNFSPAPVPAGTPYVSSTTARDIDLNRINYIIIGCVLIAIMIVIILVALYQLRRRISCCRPRIPKSETAQAIIGLNDNEQNTEEQKKSSGNNKMGTPSPRLRTQINVILLESNLHPPRKWFRSSELKYIDDDENDDGEAFEN